MTQQQIVAPDLRRKLHYGLGVPVAATPEGTEGVVPNGHWRLV